ncbi:MAG: PEP-CTERM sorting domain-containing protein [bacterium]|nr:PEP-CTERM sorting domain-containing protein [bacterium]
MLTGKRLGVAVLAAVVLVLGSGAASADIVQLTFEGTVTPYSLEETYPNLPVHTEGTPFDVTIDVCIDFHTILITPGPPNSVNAQGTVLSWDITGDTWSEHYDAAAFTAGFTTQVNQALVAGAYLEDPTLGIIPLLAFGDAVVSGITPTLDPVTQLPTGSEAVEALLLGAFDPVSGQIVVSGGMAETTTTATGSTETGYVFVGTLTGYSVCDSVVPEPASLSLLALGIGAVVARKMRKRA